MIQFILKNEYYIFYKDRKIMSKTPFPVVNNTYTNCFKGLNYLKKMMNSTNKEKLKEFFSVYLDDEDLHSKKEEL